MGTETNRMYVDGRAVADLEIAATARARSRGLLGRTGIEGALWLAPAKQVHTFGMRFTIDVAHLDRTGRVLAVARMPPGRIGAIRWRSKGVLEAADGAFAEWGLAPGALVSW